MNSSVVTLQMKQMSENLWHPMRINGCMDQIVPKHEYDYSMSPSDNIHFNISSPDSGKQSCTSDQILDDVFNELDNTVKMMPKQSSTDYPINYSSHPKNLIKMECGVGVFDTDKDVNTLNFHNQQVASHDDGNMDIYRDLILRHLIQDITNTCLRLYLPNNPCEWNPTQSAKWIQETCGQFHLKEPRQLLIPGRALMSMSLEDFIRLAPEGGDTLHAQLQLWKTAYDSCPAPNNYAYTQLNHNHTPPANQKDNNEWQRPSLEINESKRNQYLSNGNDNKQYYGNSMQYPNPNVNTANHFCGSNTPIPQLNTNINVLNNNIQSPEFNHNSFETYFSHSTKQQIPINNQMSPSHSASSSSSIYNEEDDYNIHNHAHQYNNPTPQLDFYNSNNMNINRNMQCKSMFNPEHTQQMASIGMNNSPDSFKTNNIVEGPKVCQNNSPTFQRASGNVHLWHFIRELLDQPLKYSTCVRWVDRSEGTFKIESSHHLAKFWGLRKNRTQMNYDKLSRSLRQYYKKGIIQKPEKKQRLVYKFLPPYNL
uniref:ETS domain-containing protein n=1 Tax=Rhabditophanes sp. KR3021 TaxID=114890 RepID=A0AC35U045_9BILA